MSRSALVLMMLVLTATGCVATRHAPLAEQDATSLTGKTLERSVYQKPSFVAFTAGKARLGALGAVAMIGAGNKIVQDNAVQDPAFRTAEGNRRGALSQVRPPLAGLGTAHRRV